VTGIALTSTQLLAAAPNALPNVVAAIVEDWPVQSVKYQITTRNRMLGFLSVCIEESGGLTALVEDDNYSAARAAQVFPSIFPTVASAEPYAGNPVAFANKVYDGRMGNILGSNDGWNFRGQGLLQVTGRDEFAALSKATGLSLLANPNLVSSDEYLLECALATFNMYAYGNILVLCDAGNFEGVWALVGDGTPSGPVVNLANHEAALAALEKTLTALRLAFSQLEKVIL
jgi:putative chitinase